jgi:hypothetical protein
MKNTNNDILIIEKRLDSILRPVNPEESYITDLKERLKRDPGISIDKPDYILVLFIIGSFFIFGLIIVLLINLLKRKNSR